MVFDKPTAQNLINCSADLIFSLKLILFQKVLREWAVTDISCNSPANHPILYDCTLCILGNLGYCLGNYAACYSSCDPFYYTVDTYKCYKE